MDEKKTKGSKKGKKTFIKEAPEEIVDLADIRSIGNVLSKYFTYVLGHMSCISWSIIDL